MNRRKSVSWIPAGFIGVAIAVAFPEMAHKLWWDKHSGSEAYFNSRFPWFCVVFVVAVLVIYVAVSLAKEYWPIFFTSSQEEHNGIQR